MIAVSKQRDVDPAARYREDATSHVSATILIADDDGVSRKLLRRLLEQDGHVVFEMLNTRPGSGEFNYPLSEAIWLSSDTSPFKEGVPCANHISSSGSP